MKKNNFYYPIIHSISLSCFVSYIFCLICPFLSFHFSFFPSFGFIQNPERETVCVCVCPPQILLIRTTKVQRHLQTPPIVIKQSGIL